MRMATKLKISQAAALYQKSRNTLYQAIQKGILSKDQDGLLDLSELIRVYGEPKTSPKSIKAIDVPQERAEQSQDTTTAQLLAVLKRENELLRQQLDEAKERELFQRELIQSMNQKLIPLIGHLNSVQDSSTEQLSTVTEDTENKGTEQNTVQPVQCTEQPNRTVEDTSQTVQKKQGFWQKLFS
jgi:predicted transposase YdaD